MAPDQPTWLRRLAPGPLLRRALVLGGRRGALFSGVAAVVLLCAARAAPALVTDATADRAFAAEVDAVPDGAPYDRRIGLRAYATKMSDPDLVHRLEEQVDRLAIWGSPVASYVPERYLGPFPRPEPVVRRADGQGDAVTVVLHARTGAIESLVDVDGAAPSETTDGVWLPDHVAASLGVVAGDAVELELVEVAEPDVDPPPPPSVAGLIVAGVYATDDTGLPQSTGFDWSTVVTDLPDDPDAVEAVAPLALVPVDRVVDVAAAMDDTVRVVWDAAWEGPYTVDRGRAATRSLGALAAVARDPFQGIGALTVGEGLPPLRLASGAPTFVERSDETAAALRPLVDSMAVAIQLITAGLVAAGVWLLAARRHRELRLALSHGMHPVGLGVLGAAEHLVPIGIGAVLAWSMVDAGAELAAGAGSVAPAARDQARAAVVDTVPWVLALVALVWTVAAAARQPARSSLVRTLGPALRWEVVVTVLAAAAGYQLATDADAAGSSTSLLFPILSALAGSASVAALVAVGVRRSRARASDVASTPPRHLSMWLMVRRVAAGLSDGAAVIVVVSTGIGLVGYTAAAAAAADAGIQAKAAVLAGARNTAVIPWSGALTGAAGMPADLRPGWSVVWTDRGVDVGAARDIDLVIVDPATITRSASWRPSFAERPVTELLDRMAAVPTDRVGIVVTGFHAAGIPASGTMTNGLWTVAFQVVDRVEALPGLRDRSTMAMIDANRLFALLPPNELPIERMPGRSTDNPDGNFRTEVWSSGPSEEFREVLADAGLEPPEIRGTAVERARPDLVAYGWSLPVLRIVGGVAVAVAIVAMAMQAARRRSTMVRDVVMMRQMGVAPTTIRIAVVGELVVSVLIGSGVGTAVAYGLARFMIPRLDPAPLLRPGFVVEVEVAPVVVAIGVVLCAAIVVSALELRAVRRARRAEVFRV